MLEYPEVVTLARQLNQHGAGRRVAAVLPPSKPHKFCWYNGDPAAYEERIRGAAISGARGFGIFVETQFDNGQRLCFNDGVNARLLPQEQLPKAYQLAVLLGDGWALSFTVSMYGSIVLHAGDYESEYYQKSRQAISPLDPAFPDYYWQTLKACKPTLSAKAFLATEQRFAGVGNGCVQDILLAAHIHPKRKINTLSEAERKQLLEMMVAVLSQMCRLGGRDSEKDLLGEPGGYPVKMDKRAPARGCPLCGGAVAKESYLGGSVYYCPHCQAL